MLTPEQIAVVYVTGFFAVLIYAGYHGLNADLWGIGAVIWPLVLAWQVFYATMVAAFWIAFIAPLRLGRWIRSARHD